MEPVSTKPPGPLPISSAPRAAQIDDAQASQTDLAHEKTVNPAAAAEPELSSRAVRFDAENKPAGKKTTPAIKQENVLDPITKGYVYREIDKGTGEIVRQIPQESLLRLRQMLRNSAAKSPAGDEVNRNL